MFQYERFVLNIPNLTYYKWLARLNTFLWIQQKAGFQQSLHIYSIVNSSHDHHIDDVLQVVKLIKILDRLLLKKCDQKFQMKDVYNI